MKVDQDSLKGPPHTLPDIRLQPCPQLARCQFIGIPVKQCCFGIGMSAYPQLDDADGLYALPRQRKGIGVHSVAIGLICQQQGIQYEPVRQHWSRFHLRHHCIGGDGATDALHHLPRGVFGDREPFRHWAGHVIVLLGRVLGC